MKGINKLLTISERKILVDNLEPRHCTIWTVLTSDSNYLIFPIIRKKYSNESFQWIEKFESLIGTIDFVLQRECEYNSARHVHDDYWYSNEHTTAYNLVVLNSDDITDIDNTFNANHCR